MIGLLVASFLEYIVHPFLPPTLEARPMATLQDLVTTSQTATSTIAKDTATLTELQAKIADDTKNRMEADSALAAANRAQGGASGPYTDPDGSVFAVLNDDNSQTGWRKLTLAPPTTVVEGPTPEPEPTPAP